MSGNFAIKGGEGGRTPNGKCHLKFPFWFSAPFPNPQKWFFTNFRVEVKFGWNTMEQISQGRAKMEERENGEILMVLILGGSTLF